MSWDDLRYVLAVARHSSLSGAARALGVNHSTVFRRIGAIEDRLKVRLFERLSSGYVPTPAGQEAFTAAKEVEAEMTALERRITGADLRLSGTIPSHHHRDPGLLLFTILSGRFSKTAPGHRAGTDGYQSELEPHETGG